LATVVRTWLEDIAISDRCVASDLDDLGIKLENIEMEMLSVTAKRISIQKRTQLLSMVR